MQELPLSTTISVIVALVAIVSPILTAIINNCYLLKFKKIELRQREYEQNALHKRKLFEDFLSAFNNVCHMKSADALSQYASTYSLVYIYLPDKVRKDIGTVNLLISKHYWDEAIKYVDAVSMDVSHEMKALEPKRK